MQNTSSNGQPPMDVQPLPMPTPAGMDHLQVFWRWKWLTIFGALIGCFVGYLMFLRTPPTYEAVATLQVLTPQDDLLPLSMLESGFAGCKQPSR